MASGSGKDSRNQDLPRGLIGRRGAPTGKAARLPSLRGPRDLTLGGVPKKVFTPNIPSRRDKLKEEVSGEQQQVEQVSKESSSKGRGHGGRERSRGRGRGRGQDNVIQSHSIFEQGPADRLLPKSGSTSWDSGDRVQTSRVTVKKEKNKYQSKRVLDHLLKDDFIADGPEDDPSMIPVRLPLSTSVMKEEKPDIKEKFEAKTGGDSSVDVNQPDGDKASSSFAKTYTRIEDPILTCKDLLSKCSKSETGGHMLFFQLPDALPGLPSGRDENPNQRMQTEPGTDISIKKEDGQKDDQGSLSKKLSTCSLLDFSEGYIGKLQIRKSGKAQLVLGNVTLDVSIGTPCGFLQDLVSVRVEEGSGHMTVLGHVKERLICMPDFETLLNT